MATVLLERFETKYITDPETGCWIWTAARSEDGYGHFGFEGRVWYAHRWVWEQINGPVPKDMELDHFACSTRACVNPAHLRPVSHRENVLRGNGLASLAASRTHCPQGHPYSAANLYVNPQGARLCKACRTDASRRYRDRNRERYRAYRRDLKRRRRAEGKAD